VEPFWNFVGLLDFAMDGWNDGIRSLALLAVVWRRRLLNMLFSLSFSKVVDLSFGASEKSLLPIEFSWTMVDFLTSGFTVG
jgi:hypothetical protein